MDMNKQQMIQWLTLCKQIFNKPDYLSDKSISLDLDGIDNLIKCLKE